ncbi:MAG: hypothetical protein WC501_04015 [Candidatus Micrarchaeia archaeon]
MKNVKKTKETRKKNIGKNVCIISKKELDTAELKDAKKVKDDAVIKFIRKIKKKLNMETGNNLYVSKGCIEEHTKRRKSFEKGLLIAAILAVLIFFGLVILPIIFTQSINFGSIMLGILLAIIMVVFFGLIKYTPQIEK